MSTLAPEMNMVVLANAAELTTAVFYAMVGEDVAKKYFGTSESRSVLADATMTAIQRRLGGVLRERPTGQFTAAVKRAGTQSAMRLQRAASPATAL